MQWLHFDALLALKAKTFHGVKFSAEVTLICASAVPPCRDEKKKKKKQKKEKLLRPLNFTTMSKLSTIEEQGDEEIQR